MTTFRRSETRAKYCCRAFLELLPEAKARNHRQILLGTWLLARKDDNPAVEKLIAEELEGFLAESPVKVSLLMFQDLLNQSRILIVA